MSFILSVLEGAKIFNFDRGEKSIQRQLEQIKAKAELIINTLT